MSNGPPFTVEKISPRAGLEPGTARSVGQRLKENRPIKSTVEFLLKLYTMMKRYMVSEKMK